MATKKSDEHAQAFSTAGEASRDKGVNNDDTGLSPAGLLCDNILSTLNELPDLPEKAKLLLGVQVSNLLGLFQEQEEREENTRRQLSKLKGNLRLAREQLAVLRQELFDKSSERGLGGEDAFNPEFDDGDEDDEDEPKQAPRGKRARKMPAGTTPQVVHYFPEDRTCSCCGDEMKSISSWDRIVTRVIPEHVEFVRHVYHTCACNKDARCKENKPVSAKAGHFIMRGRSVDPHFAAEAAVQKFFEHIPTFRMERRLQNANVNLSRQAISSSVAHLAGYLEPVRLALLDHVKAGAVVHADETPVRIQAPGKGKCDTGYFWALCRDERNWNPTAEPAVVYEFAPSRAGIVAESLLDGAATRFLTTDGYSGYNRLFRLDDANDGLMSARCWAHARRKFYEAHLATKSPLANRTVKRIRKLYAVEKAARGLPPEEREKMRQEQSLPVLTEIYTDLIENAEKAHGLVRGAINYTLNAFDGLKRFVFDGRIEIDNNAVERCIRGIALTKKNSLFAGNHDSAEVWAIYYTLIESAGLNGINPRSYLHWVVEQIEVTRGTSITKSCCPGIARSATSKPDLCRPGRYGRGGSLNTSPAGIRQGSGPM